MERNLNACPNCMSSRAWAIALACDTGRNEDVRRHFDALIAHSPNKGRVVFVDKTIESFHGLLKDGRCAPGETYNAYMLLERLIATRPSQARKEELFKLWLQLSRLYMLDGKKLKFPVFGLRRPA